MVRNKLFFISILLLVHFICQMIFSSAEIISNILRGSFESNVALTRVCPKVFHFLHLSTSSLTFSNTLLTEHAYNLLILVIILETCSQAIPKTSFRIENVDAHRMMPCRWICRNDTTLSNFKTSYIILITIAIYQYMNRLFL